MNDELSPAFPGFPDFRANVTFVPIQFFTVVLPHFPRGVVRLVGYALRKVLGWVDEHGNPTREQLQFTYRELIEQAGVSRESLAEALAEAVRLRCLRCVQAPAPDTAGRAAQSGRYELCWDDEGRYTDDPAAFRGFYFPEAVVIEEPTGAGLLRRPKAARKNIPNAFFDYLLPQEPLSVIRVVGALLFYSIQWGPGGERRLPVTRSITDLSRLTNLSRHHVHAAVTAACQRGYIQQQDAGHFDPAAGQASRAATYGIRWTNGVCETGAGPTAQASPAVPVRKGERNRSEIVNGKRSEKVNGISIKTDLKTNTAAAKNPSAAAPSPIAAAASISEQLKQTGFDDLTARRLVNQCAPEVITRQLAWLPLRHSTRNRLGLLRRAIEEDWPKPEGHGDDEGQQRGRLFASHYYAAYHGYGGEAKTEAFPKDTLAAAKFVERLLALRNEPKLVPEWGRQFGGFIRRQHQADSKARPNLAAAIVLHGDEFLRRQDSNRTASTQSARQKAEAARHAALWPAYLAYLGPAEIEAQRAAPDLYAAFLAQRERTRQTMTGGLFHASAETLARFDSNESRHLALAEFCRSQQTSLVLDFDSWCNQRSSLRKSASPNSSDENVVRFSLQSATGEMKQVL